MHRTLDTTKFNKTSIFICVYVIFIYFFLSSKREIIIMADNESPKIPEEVQKKIECLLEVFRVCFQYGYMPLLVYLGWTKGPDRLGAPFSFSNFLWNYWCCCNVNIALLKRFLGNFVCCVWKILRLKKVNSVFEWLKPFTNCKKLNYDFPAKIQILNVNNFQTITNLKKKCLQGGNRTKNCVERDYQQSSTGFHYFLKNFFFNCFPFKKNCC